MVEGARIGKDGRKWDGGRNGGKEQGEGVSGRGGGGGEAEREGARENIEGAMERGSEGWGKE